MQHLGTEEFYNSFNKLYFYEIALVEKQRVHGNGRPAVSIIYITTGDSCWTLFLSTQHQDHIFINYFINHIIMGSSLGPRRPDCQFGTNCA